MKAIGIKIEYPAQNKSNIHCESNAPGKSTFMMIIIPNVTVNIGCRAIDMQVKIVFLITLVKVR